MTELAVFDEASDIPQAAIERIVSWSNELQQERAAKKLVRYLTNQLPAKRFSVRQRKGFLNNGINQNALMAGLAVWGR